MDKHILHNTQSEANDPARWTGGHKTRSEEKREAMMKRARSSVKVKKPSIFSVANLYLAVTVFAAGFTALMFLPI